MSTDLGIATLLVRTVNHQDQYFNCKLVFVNLESVLGSKGYEIQSAETRQDGRGTAPALRIGTSYQQRLNVQIDTRLRLVDSNDTYFKHRLVFDNLEDNLKTHGFVVGSCSTREDGQHSPLAIRVTLSRR